jgi:hypothetical protein
MMRIASSLIVILALVLAFFGGGQFPRRTNTPCKFRTDSRSPSSGDTKAGR